MVNFNDSETYPNEIKNWVLNNFGTLKSIISKNDNAIPDLKRNIVKNGKLDAETFVSDFIQRNNDLEFCLWHATRIQNEDQILNNGIVALNRNTDQNKIKYIKLFESVGLTVSEMEPILKKMECYWNRDKESRLETVHFFFPESMIEDPQINIFAINIGGEIVRWAIEDIDPNLYRQEPYKRLWILGKPCIIQFKSDLEKMTCGTQESIILELIMHYVYKFLLNSSYGMECTGYQLGSVLPQNILDVKEIKNYIKIQEKFEEYKNFYPKH